MKNILSRQKKYHVVTDVDSVFAEEIAAQINKDYPNVAIVRGGRCLITQDHYEFCKKHVKGLWDKEWHLQTA